MQFDSPWEQRRKLNNNKVKHKPLKTSQEIADELGISVRQLSGMLSSKNAPKNKFICQNRLSKKSYFDPDEVKKFYFEWLDKK